MPQNSLEDILQLVQCDTVRVDDAKKADLSIKIISNAAFVLCEEKGALVSVVYVNKINKTIKKFTKKEILNLFEEKIKPSNETRTLTLEEINRIRIETGFCHSGHLIESPFFGQNYALNKINSYDVKEIRENIKLKIKNNNEDLVNQMAFIPGEITLPIVAKIGEDLTKQSKSLLANHLHPRLDSVDLNSECFLNNYEKDNVLPMYEKFLLGEFNKFNEDQFTKDIANENKNFFNLINSKFTITAECNNYYYTFLLTVFLNKLYSGLNIFLKSNKVERLLIAKNFNANNLRLPYKMIQAIAKLIEIDSSMLVLWNELSTYVHAAYFRIFNAIQKEYIVNDVVTKINNHYPPVDAEEKNLTSFLGLYKYDIALLHFEMSKFIGEKLLTVKIASEEKENVVEIAQTKIPQEDSAAQSEISKIEVKVEEKQKIEEINIENNLEMLLRNNVNAQPIAKIKLLKNFLINNDFSHYQRAALSGELDKMSKNTFHSKYINKQRSNILFSIFSTSFIPRTHKELAESKHKEIEVTQDIKGKIEILINLHSSLSEKSSVDLFNAVEKLLMDICELLMISKDLASIENHNPSLGFHK